MGTEIANLPPMIRHYGRSLGPRAASTHRAWIGVQVEALLDGYWNSRPSDLVKEEILADWMAILEPYSPEEISAARREWLRESPRNKPRPGDIAEIVQRERAKALAAWRKASPAPEPDREPRVTAEAANDILARAGYLPKRMAK